MEKFFDAGTLTQEELVERPEEGDARAQSSFRWCARPGLSNIGAQPLLDAARRLRAVAGRAAVQGARRRRAPRSTRTADDKAPYAAFVWKTVADQFAGRITMFRVYQGSLEGRHDGAQRDAGRAGAARPSGACCRARRRRPCPKSRPATSAPSPS